MYTILSILHDLTIRPHSCPRQLKNINYEDFDRLINLVIAHKLDAFTYHLYTCKLCGVRFTKSQLLRLKNHAKQKALVPKLLYKERDGINNFFKKNKVKALLYKDVSWLPIYQDGKISRTIGDLDFLIDYKNFQKVDKLLKTHAWVLKENNEIFNRSSGKRWQEKVYIKKNFQLMRLDIQWSAGMTRGRFFNFTGSLSLEKIVQDSLKKIIKNGVVVPPKYIQIILNSSHFYFHDNCFGLRQALEIKEIALNMNKNDWDLCLKLLKKSGLEKSFWFTLLIIEKLFFQKIIPDKFAFKLNRRQVIISQLYPIFQIQCIKTTASIKFLLYKLEANFLSVLSLF